MTKTLAVILHCHCAVLHLLRGGSIVHSCSHHGEEHIGAEGAGVDGHLGERRGNQHLFPLVIKSLHDLSRCLSWRNTVGFLRKQNCRQR